MSFHEDDINKFRHEIIENLDEEKEDYDENSSASALDKKDAIFPHMGRVESTSVTQHHREIAEEFEYEEAIFNEVLKKRHQGFNARNMVKKAQRAWESNLSTGKSQLSVQTNLRSEMSSGNLLDSARSERPK